MARKILPQPEILCKVCIMEKTSSLRQLAMIKEIGRFDRHCASDLKPRLQLKRNQLKLFPP